MVRLATPLRDRLARRAGRDADVVLRLDLAALPDEHRAAAAAFVEGRVRGLPSPMAVGVGAVAVILATAGRVLGTRRVLATVSRLHPPLAGDYLRLLRSLAYAYVWETWPATAHDGAPCR